MAEDQDPPSRRRRDRRIDPRARPAQRPARRGSGQGAARGTAALRGQRRYRTEHGRTCPPRRAPAEHGRRRLWLRRGPAGGRGAVGTPRLVGEVRYSTRTRTGRLRHPSWHRLRPDLSPDDLT
ncbi:hypothetical protein [Streptomyces anulatus]|uniref:ATP dependent DNA ligase n=1 Tax=Streptomyces anulatus TaxID=1892 RepID=UPI0033D4C878